MSEPWTAASYWSPIFRDETFPTVVVPLTEGEVYALSQGIVHNDDARNAIEKLRTARAQVPNMLYVFASADTVSPTDTERFRRRGGAINSADSIWRVLCESVKVQLAAKEKAFSHLVLRPFRNMTYAREFRLFIHGRSLYAMSQYYLARHFRRLAAPKVRDHYWDCAEAFVKKIADRLPADNVVLDIYFTHGGEIIMIDFNTFGPPTQPLLMRKWEQDWTQKKGVLLLPPPTVLSGSVNVGP